MQSKKFRPKRLSGDFIRIFLSKDRICFLDSTSQLLNFLAIRGYTWHKIEKQRYNDDATVVNKIETQQNQNKILFVVGCLPKALSFMPLS